jgi:O-antigen/teichoic acid export membrane protein
VARLEGDPPERRSLSERATSGGRWALVSAASTTAAQLIQLILFARALTPTEFGGLAVLIILVGFAQTFLDLGFSGALIFRQDATAAERSSLYWVNVIGGLALSAALFLAAPLLAGVFASDSLIPYIQAIAPVCAIGGVGKQFEVLLQKDLAFRPIGIIESAAAIASTAAAAAGLALGLDLWAYAVGVLTLWTVRALAFVVVGWRSHAPAARLRLSDLSRYWAFAAYQMGERAVNFVAQRVDQVLVAALLGPTRLGFYNLAFNLTAQPVGRINPIVTRVGFPALALVQSDRARLGNGYMRILRLVTVVNAPLLLGLLAVAPTFVPAVFGTAWEEAVPLVQLLAIVGLFRSIGNPVGSLQLATGRADLGFTWNLFVAGTAVPVVYLGAELGGTIGVAWALVMHQTALQMPAYLYFVRRLTDIPLRAYVLTLATPTVLAATMAGAVAIIGVAFDAEPSGYVAAVQIVAGATLYLALLAVFSREDLVSLARLLGLGSRRKLLQSWIRPRGSLRR